MLKNISVKNISVKNFDHFRLKSNPFFNRVQQFEYLQVSKFLLFKII